MESYYLTFGKMSKIGYKSITVPASVQLTINDKHVTVKGSKGELHLDIPDGIAVKQNGESLTVERSSEKKDVRALHGLFRSMLSNAVVGVETPWEKRLTIVGTGYNAKMQGEDIVLKLGYSHLITFAKVEGVQYKVEGNNKIVVSGINKQIVGQVAHQIKILKKPDAYKGKGVRYEDEVVRLKPGKKAKA